MAQRSQPLHNFVMPTHLRWGNQRYLRCMKSNPNSHLRSYQSEADSDEKDLSFLYAKHKSKIRRHETDVIEDFRAKILLHLPMKPDKTFRVEEQEESVLCGTRATPWNLRTRRSACKAPVKERLKLVAEKKQKNLNLSSPQRIESLSLRLKRLAEKTGKNQELEKKERRKFSVSISPDEIKEDFLIMTGNNPSRRPKKRAKLLQKQFDFLSPGFWLNEITVDSYRVPDEVVEIKK